MKIIEKDIDSLKQLDRIEYRQKYEECYVKYDVGFNINTGLLMMVIVMLSILKFPEDKITNLMGAVIAVVVTLFAYYVLWWKDSTFNKNVVELNQEYFKIEKK